MTNCNICESIVGEILSRVPAKDLIRYKAVCKPWKSLIEDPNFIDLHKSRTRKSVIATVTDAADAATASIHGGDVFFWSRRHGRIMGPSTEGLVCIKTNENKYFVINPTTGKSLQLPPFPYYMEHSFGIDPFVRAVKVFGIKVYFIPQSQQFKVAVMCINSRPHVDEMIWGLFTIGVDCSWRYEILEFEGAEEMTCIKAFFCKTGIMGLIRYKTLEGLEVMQAYKFDIDEEIHLLKNLPSHLKSIDKKSLWVSLWDGNFSISKIDENEIDAWILEDDGNQLASWRNEIICIPNQDKICFNGSILILFVDGRKMWLKKKYGKRIIYSFDLVTKIIEEIEPNVGRIHDFHPFQSTLATIRGKK